EALSAFGIFHRLLEKVQVTEALVKQISRTSHQCSITSQKVKVKYRNVWFCQKGGNKKHLP
ncbi:hypothetical protein, partial [Vibrio parahaemolyticus]|uniref:hypothetical protein n=1 Tax=Vibrio parahaemolyticus TaxID=670 RepID=UPI001E43DE67